jgi:hypothetical protein
MPPKKTCPKHIRKEYNSINTYTIKKHGSDLIFYMNYEQSTLFEEYCEYKPQFAYTLLILYKHIDGIKPIPINHLYEGLRRCGKNVDLAKHIIELYKTDNNYKQICKFHIKNIFKNNTNNSIEYRKYLITLKDNNKYYITNEELVNSINDDTSLECLKWSLNLYKEEPRFRKISYSNNNSLFINYCYAKQYDKARYMCNLHNINSDYSPIGMTTINEGFRADLFLSYSDAEERISRSELSYDFICYILDLHNNDKSYEPIEMDAINEYISYEIECEKTLDKLINLYREDPAYMMITNEVLLECCDNCDDYIEKLVIRKYLRKNDFVNKLIYL